MIMAKIPGFKSEAPVKGFPMLPKGAYVCGIKNVKIDGDAPDQQIVFRVDIIEGDEAGYFTKRYNHDKDNAQQDRNCFLHVFSPFFRILRKKSKRSPHQNPGGDRFKALCPFCAVRQILKLLR